MREHLYQGKRLDNGEWVEGNLIHRTDYYGDPVDDYFIVEVGSFDYDDYFAYEVDPETVSEFTGLRDKNGESIFEGDIVRVTTPQGRVADVLVQNGEYFDGEELYIGVYGTIDGRSAAMHAGKDEHYEVIGNKWDNPELLKGGEE